MTAVVPCCCRTARRAFKARSFTRAYKGQLTGSAHPIARYSPQTDLFYVAVREMGSYYYKGDASINRAPFLGAEANVRWTAMKPGVRYAL